MTIKNKNNNNEFSNDMVNDGGNKIINEQQKEIDRLNQLLIEKDSEISNLIKEKGQMQRRIQELEQKIGKYMQIDNSDE